MFKNKGWVVCHYKQVLESFYFNVFRELVTYVPIGNLYVFKKILLQPNIFFIDPFSCFKSFVSLL